MKFKLNKILISFVFVIFLGHYLNANENENELPISILDKFWPQGGLFYQAHLGATLVLGTLYATLDHHKDGALSGPYIEAGIGTNGYSTDIGWAWGVGGLIWGTSLSYINIDEHHAIFDYGSYYGLAIKTSVYSLSLRGGVYHEPKLNDSKISLSIGLGF